MPGKKKLSLEEQLNLIESTFIDSLNGANAEQLKAKFAEVAKAEEANQSAKKADEDLNSKKDAVAAASEGYRELTKKNRLKIKFLIRQLSDKGDAEAMQIVANDAATEG